jgi:hypothetical protein
MNLPFNMLGLIDITLPPRLSSKVSSREKGFNQYPQECKHMIGDQACYRDSDALT